MKDSLPQCDKSLEYTEELTKHNMQQHASTDDLNTCQVCETKVDEKQLSLRCNMCEFIFHKKCTDLRSATGYWKPKQWRCSYCPESCSSSLNQAEAESNADIDNTDKITASANENPIKEPNVPKLPPVSKKHRKTTLNIHDPDAELYQTQIDILRAENAKKEAENKKIRESNDLKAKRIITLESELQQARLLLNQQAGQAEQQSRANNQSNVDLLEQKTMHLENQYSSLIIKVDLIHEMLSSNQNQAKIANPRRKPSCTYVKNVTLKPM